MQNTFTPSETLRALRLQVIEDAYELVAAVELFEPLIAMRVHRGDGEDMAVPRVLLRILSRAAIVAFLRMADDPKRGSTGTAAGLPALLRSAVQEGAVSRTDADRLKGNLIALKASDEGGVQLRDLLVLRHTKLAHSLIPHPTVESNMVWADVVIQRSRQLLQIVADVEHLFEQNGVIFVGQPRLETEEDWQRRSLSFWSRLVAG